MYQATGNRGSLSLSGRQILYSVINKLTQIKDIAYLLNSIFNILSFHTINAANYTKEFPGTESSV